MLRFIKDLGTRRDVGGTTRRWCLVKCEYCGSLVERRTTQAKTNKSCGCATFLKANTKHGDSTTRLYQVWADMKTRCLNTNNPRYHRYGGRGITVCTAWLEYPAFKSWAILSGYTDKLTIDRVNNDGNYTPTNCEWVTIQENLKRRDKSMRESKLAKREGVDLFDENRVPTLENMTDTNKEVLIFLSSRPEKYTLVGSRSLLKNAEFSDFDFVCHVDNLTPWFGEVGFVLDIRNYVNVMPMGNGYLVKFMDDIDLLVYDNPQDVEAIKATIKFMQNLRDPLEEFFEVKACRVQMFESLYKYYQNKERENE